MYTGYHTTLRLDLELLEKLAPATPQWDWIMVGPEDNDFAASPLHQEPNVYFLGKKHVEQVPGYIYHADVCINPQILNEITKGNYPLKIDEYLAMGKPSVATRTPFMKSFGNSCLLASGVQEWIAAISTALEQNTPEQASARRAIALSHSWENNVKAILDVVAKCEA
jgi:glycosyltransferase involved in cell wall biosynthesis